MSELRWSVGVHTHHVYVIRGAVWRVLVESMGLPTERRAVGRRRIRDAGRLEGADQKTRGLTDTEFCAEIPGYVDAICQLLDRTYAERRAVEFCPQRPQFVGNLRLIDAVAAYPLRSSGAIHSVEVWKVDLQIHSVSDRCDTGIVKPRRGPRSAANSTSRRSRSACRIERIGRLRAVAGLRRIRASQYNRRMRALSGRPAPLVPHPYDSRRTCLEASLTRLPHTHHKFVPSAGRSLRSMRGRSP